jgi:hypothetical protein
LKPNFIWFQFFSETRPREGAKTRARDIFPTRGAPSAASFYKKFFAREIIITAAAAAAAAA